MGADYRSDTSPDELALRSGGDEYSTSDELPVYGPAPRNAPAGHLERFLQGLAAIHRQGGARDPGASFVTGLLHGIGVGAQQRRARMDRQDAESVRLNAAQRAREFSSYDRASANANDALKEESRESRLDRRAAAGKASPKRQVALPRWITGPLEFPAGYQVDEGSESEYGRLALDRLRFNRGDDQSGGSYRPILPEDTHALTGAHELSRDAEGDYRDAVRAKDDALKAGAAWFPRPTGGQRTATPPAGVLPDTTSSARRSRTNMPAARRAYAAADSTIGAARGQLDNARQGETETRASSLIAAIERAKNPGQLARALASVPKGSSLEQHAGVRDAYAKAKARFGGAGRGR